MAKYKKQKKIVGTENLQVARISKPLFNLIISFQKELQETENNKKNRKPRKITFAYASLELSRRIEK